MTTTTEKKDFIFFTAVVAVIYCIIGVFYPYYVGVSVVFLAPFFIKGAREIWGVKK